MKIFYMLLSLILCSTLFAQDHKLTLSLAEKLVEVKNESLTLGTAKLLYKARDGVLDETMDTYLIAFLNGRYPQIIDRFLGHTTTIKLFDLDSDGLDEVLVFFHAGNKQYKLKGYRLLEDLIHKEITPIDGMHLSSNMRSIEVLPEKMLVKNQQWIIDDETAALLTVDEYRYVDGELVLDRTSTQKIYE